MIVKKCNICGKTFDEIDENEDFEFSERCGYGSKYDGFDIQINMCCDCFDALIDDLRKKCVYSPIKEI